MPTEILISSDPWENRVAIREDGQLAEIYFEREEKVIGSIFKGKVMNVLPGMGASFVDIGLGRNAFLYVDDINKTPLNIGDVEITQGRSGWTITEKISKGDDVLVQIVKEPRGLKGARISTNISLPGRYLILMPTGKYSGVSRKIESADERNRLKNIMKMIRPEGMATVVRTAASGVSQAELIADLGVLIRMWHGILESYKRAPAPSLIHKDMNLVFKAARDFITPEVDKVLIDDREDFEKVRDFMRLLGPQYVERIEYYNNGRSLFKDFKVDEEVEKLLRPKVNLHSGGSIVIETTEALTIIDVNSGKFTGGRNLEDTIVKTNIEAAAEIARQVRLRDIGGIIVCDFIDMSTENARTRVIETLKAGLERDRTRTTIQSFSALGLLEFTRKRVGKDLSGQLRGACPTCVGLGTVMSPESVAIETFRELRRVGHERENGATSPMEVISAPTVGAQIEYWYADELAGLEKELETTIAVRVDAALHPEKTRIGRLPDVAAAKSPPPNVRVGDELEVDLVHARLPIATSALAIVGDRLVEVENASNAAGETIKIKVIDIDDEGTILAEPRHAVADQSQTDRKRRRRGGRGRAKPLTPAEQEEQLRELAEEAAKGIGARPALGISTSAEAEAEDAEVRAHTPTTPPLATVTAAARRARLRGRRSERRRPSVRELRRSGRRRRPSSPPPPPPPSRSGRGAGYGGPHRGPGFGRAGSRRSGRRFRGRGAGGCRFCSCGRCRPGRRGRRNGAQAPAPPSPARARRSCGRCGRDGRVRRAGSPPARARPAHLPRRRYGKCRADRRDGTAGAGARDRTRGPQGGSRRDRAAAEEPERSRGPGEGREADASRSQSGRRRTDATRARFDRARSGTGGDRSAAATRAPAQGRDRPVRSGGICNGGTGSGSRAGRGCGRAGEAEARTSAQGRRAGRADRGGGARTGSARQTDGRLADDCREEVDGESSGAQSGGPGRAEDGRTGGPEEDARRRGDEYAQEDALNADSPTPNAAWAVFVDFDGTITDGDTFDVLVRHFAGEAEWNETERGLDTGARSLCDVLARQAALVRGELAEVAALLRREIAVDPAFAPFARACRSSGIPVTIVSSGLDAIVRDRLREIGLDDLPVIANAVDARPDGWIIRFRDDVANGTDKAAVLRAARANGPRTVFVGDGRSDYDAAREADVRFAKRGLSLESYLVKLDIPFEPFVTFADVRARCATLGILP